MRRAARTDANHAAVVTSLRNAGMTVQSLAAVGQGVPDLIVGWRGVNLLMEVKDGAKFQSRQALTKMEQDWIDSWAGRVVVVDSAEAAVLAMIEYEQRMKSLA